MSTDSGGLAVPSLLPITVIHPKVELKGNPTKLVCLGQKTPLALGSSHRLIFVPPMPLRVNSVFCKKNKWGWWGSLLLWTLPLLASWGRWRWPSWCYIQAPGLAVTLIRSNWQCSSLRMWKTLCFCLHDFFCQFTRRYWRVSQAIRLRHHWCKNNNWNKFNCSKWSSASCVR